MTNGPFKESNRDLEVSRKLSGMLITKLPLASQIEFLRTTHGSRLNVFAPINDLSLLSKGGTETKGFDSVKKEVTLAGGQILGDEYSDHVVKVLCLL